MKPNLRLVSPCFTLGVLLALGAFLAVTPPAARAQVVFTFTTTANAGANTYGYGVGSVYTFVFTAGLSDPARNTFGNSQNKWLEETLEDPQLITSIGGTGLTAAYVRPTGIDDAPYSNVTDTTPDELSILVRNDAGGILGIQTLNGTDVGVIRPNSVVSGVTFDFPNTTTFDEYWYDFIGTYPASGTLTLSNAGGSTLATFNITGVAISTVPEPAVTTVVLGGLALIGGALLRRRSAARRQVTVL